MSRRSKKRKRGKRAQTDSPPKKRLVIPYWLGYTIVGLIAAGLLAFYIFIAVVGGAFSGGEVTPPGG